MDDRECRGKINGLYCVINGGAAMMKLGVYMSGVSICEG